MTTDFVVCKANKQNVLAGELQISNETHDPIEIESRLTIKVSSSPVESEIQPQSFCTTCELLVPQIHTGAWEITAGAVAFHQPFGPTVVNIAAALGVITPAQKAFYDSLPIANDPDDLPNDKDDFLKVFINPQLAALGYDPLGLNGSTIGAMLLQGDYIALHTYRWTEFHINRNTQQLRVTTFGTGSYSRVELLADPQAVINRAPEVVSEFVVAPVAVQN